MNEADALQLSWRLFSVFQTSSKIDDRQVKAYAEQFLTLRHPEALYDAINSLIRSERWLPPVADVLDEYQRHREKYAPKQLGAPAVTEAERVENARRVKAMFTHLAASGGEGHTKTMGECSHPECVRLKGDDK